MEEEKIIPIGDYLLVGVEPSYKDKSRVIITNTQPVENRGIVKGVGEKVNTDFGSTQIKEGDRVIYTPGNGVHITNSDTSDILISVRNIVGIIR